MAKYLVQKATDFETQSAKFKREHTLESLAQTHVAQRKYDGCNMLVRIGTDGYGEALSRTGEDVKSCDHIIQAVRQVFGVGWVVFGEVWKEGTPQAEISGMFRRHNAEPSLVFVVFDIVPSGSFAIGIHDVPYDTRLRHICLQLRQLRNMPNLPLREVAYYTPGSYGDPQKLANFLVAEGGYDGLILRDLRSHWVQAEAKEGELIKVKPVKSFDLRCTGVEEGLGKMAGIAGKLLFDFKGVTIKAGGGDFDKRREWFANPPVGRIFEVECLEVTLDGKLREPRLKGERFDKVKADGE